ncbi:hypothetical protein GCM10007978_13140 [Shewanella hanedai]|nr:hypothetical protein GCM10007978_13140 [Shewanella hanedai]
MMEPKINPENRPIKILVESDLVIFLPSIQHVFLHALINKTSNTLRADAFSYTYFGQ